MTLEQQWATCARLRRAYEIAGPGCKTRNLARLKVAINAALAAELNSSRTFPQPDATAASAAASTRLRGLSREDGASRGLTASKARMGGAEVGPNFNEGERA